MTAKTKEAITIFFKENYARYTKMTARGYGIALKQFFFFLPQRL